MFDIGWTEMLVIAIVMIVVVGPKDLPRMLRTFGKTTAKLRSMAGDFQKQFNEALKEAELEDVKKSVDDLRSFNPANEIKKQLNPFEKAAQDIRSGLDSALKPSPPVAAQPAMTQAHAAEPLKNGATEIPGVNGPIAMPSAPVFPANAEASAPVGSNVPEPARAAKPKVARKTGTAKTPAKPKAAEKPKLAAKPKTPAKKTGGRAS